MVFYGFSMVLSSVFGGILSDFQGTKGPRVQQRSVDI